MPQGSHIIWDSATSTAMVEPMQQQEQKVDLKQNPERVNGLPGGKRLTIRQRSGKNILLPANNRGPPIFILEMSTGMVRPICLHHEVTGMA